MQRFIFSQFTMVFYTHCILFNIFVGDFKHQEIRLKPFNKKETYLMYKLKY